MRAPNGSCWRDRRRRPGRAARPRRRAGPPRRARSRAAAALTLTALRDTRPPREPSASDSSWSAASLIAFRWRSCSNCLPGGARSGCQTFASRRRASWTSRLVERRLELQQEERLLDVEHCRHEHSTIAPRSSVAESWPEHCMQRPAYAAGERATAIDGPIELCAVGAGLHGVGQGTGVAGSLPREDSPHRAARGSRAAVRARGRQRARAVGIVEIERQQREMVGEGGGPADGGGEGRQPVDQRGQRRAPAPAAPCAPAPPSRAAAALSSPRLEPKRCTSVAGGDAGLAGDVGQRQAGGPTAPTARKVASRSASSEWVRGRPAISDSSFLVTVMPDLSDRVALVTGASRGGGAAIAAVLGEGGATVYVTGRSSRTGARTEGLPGTVEDSAEAVTARGGTGIGVVCDHTDPAQVERSRRADRRRPRPPRRARQQRVGRLRRSTTAVPSPRRSGSSRCSSAGTRCSGPASGRPC